MPDDAAGEQVERLLGGASRLGVAALASERAKAVHQVVGVDQVPVEGDVRQAVVDVRVAALGRAPVEAELAQGESAWPLIGLGIAARYQFDAGVALESHEAAFRLSRETGDARAAGRAAIELVIDCGLFRGPAEAATIANDDSTTVI